MKPGKAYLVNLKILEKRKFMKFRSIFMSLFTIPACLFAVANFQEAHAKDCHADCHPQEVHVGPLEVATVVVPDLDAIIIQWALGTGTEFGPISEHTWEVLVDGNWREVSLRHAYSVRGSPFLELVEANPPIGPWAPQTDVGSAPGFLVYAVDSVCQVGAKLEANGLELVARSSTGRKSPHTDTEFAIYRGLNGILVELITYSLVPTGGGVNVSPVPFDLGPIVHTDIAVQDQEAASIQLANALTVDWLAFPANNVPFVFPDGVHFVDTNVLASTTVPVIELEFVTPPLGPWASTDHSYNYHVAYRIPAGTMAAAITQMQNAGFTLNTSIGSPSLGIILAFFSTTDNVWIEIVDERFDL